VTPGLARESEAPSWCHPEEAERRVLSLFRRAAADVPAYRSLLAEHGVDPASVRRLEDFRAKAPLLSKGNTFARFQIDQLCAGGELPPLADVLTSSGHGGRFSFGVTTRDEAERSADMIDAAFDGAFDIRRRATLAVNCLPMGVVFSSRTMTLATTSVREDMAAALVRTFGHRYQQVVLVGDPLFLNRLLAHARETGTDWSRHRMHAIVGEETFGEHFRTYLAASLGIDLEEPDGGFIMSSFGVGELGLHLAYETRATVALRRALMAHPAFAIDLFGDGVGTSGPWPMIFAFNPSRTWFEIIGGDAHGFGSLTTSMLDDERAIPLLRYQTGDIARLLDPRDVGECARRHGVTLPAGLPASLMALRGRSSEALPGGGHVALYKDALYADKEVATQVTGAVRIVCDGDGRTVHVQRTTSGPEPSGLRTRLHHVLPPAPGPEQLVLWSQDRFPFGVQLDYERKFTSFVPGEANPLRCLP